MYDDYGGAHSTPVAAAIHLGVLPTDRVPSKQEIMALPLFDRVGNDDMGCLVYMGTDTKQNDIYILGRGPSAVIVERALASGIALAGGDAGSVLFYNTLPCVNLWMRIGGFLSRALGWTNVGRPLVLHGTRKAYPQLVQFVEAVKSSLERNSNSGMIIASDGRELGAVAGHAVKRGIVPGLQDGPLVPGSVKES